MRKILSNPFLILLLLGSVFFYKIIVYFNQMIYPSGDIFAIVAPYKIIIYETVKNFHTLPLWNPYVFSGMSFVGNPAPALFYPFTYLIFLFPLYLTFGYLYIFDSFLIGSFTYLFARTIKLNRFGSLVSAIVIMFSPV